MISFLLTNVRFVLCFFLILHKDLLLLVLDFICLDVRKWKYLITEPWRNIILAINCLQ